MSEAVAWVLYLVSAGFFIFGLKGLSGPKTAVGGNLKGVTGMTLAAITVLIARSPETGPLIAILIAMGLGGAVGFVLAKRVEMTGMPELVAAFNGVGGLASAIVALGEVMHRDPYTPTIGVVTALGVLIGALTFTGSVIAWGKLAGKVNSAPVKFPNQNLANLGLLVVALVAVILYANNLGAEIWLFVVLAVALGLGVLAVMPIGGADMPVVVALLNSYSGIAASAAGYAIGNPILIVAGALVGASGLILTVIMCKAMNRSLANVLFSAFGTGDSTGSTEGREMETRTVRNYTPEDGAILLTSARSVIVVPGYGMAVAQAQHSVRELCDLLESAGVKIQYAIHPVAGRMPGHMNVLLAEANVPYDQLKEMEVINPDFENTDVVLVVGANDVVNPAARTDKESGLYGMPILDADKSNNIIILKRSLGVGFAGEINELFFNDKTMMLFGDAKDTIMALIGEVKSLQ
ncbi:MAG: NAD(P)(+) transhydrogenase (Re/Si-specific) subunit beta [Planctomycetota bacterium]|nr:NAD(P)(+) transhydrogenase (Re/Si-specific) subunit beta [Planctomycetota bacterium]